jgi:hypothetical protein
MKKINWFPVVLFLQLGCMINILIPGNTKADDLPGLNLLSKNLSNISEPDDTIVKLPLKPPAIKPLPRKIRQTNFIQKFLSAFSFKKNADANERMRMLALINSDSMRLDTNLTITIQNIGILKNAIELNNKLIIDSLKRGILYLDSLKKNGDSLLFKLNTLEEEKKWAYELKNKLRILKYDISSGMGKLKLQSGPDSTDKTNNNLPSVKLKPADYTQSIRNNLIETNIYFFPRTAISERDSIFLKKTGGEFNENEKRSRYLYLFRYIITNPCAACITKTGDADAQALSRRYMSDLGVDSIIKKTNIERIRFNKAPFYSRFEYINHILTRLLRNISWIIFTILMILSSFYYLKNSYQGTEWRGRKVVAILSLIAIYFFIMAFFSYLYSAGPLPYIGVKSTANPAYLLDSIPLPKATNSHKEIQAGLYAHNPECKCSNISLATILLFTTAIFLIFLLFIVPRFVRLLQRRTYPEQPAVKK